MVDDLMLGPAQRRGSLSIGAVIASITLAIVCVTFLVRRGTDDRSTDTDSITVVHGAAPVRTTDSIQIRGGIRAMPPPPADEVALMEKEMAASPRDQRAASDEVRLRDIVKTTLPGLRSPVILCAGLTCRISGDMPTAIDGPRGGYFRSVSFYDAIFALGYSPGPDQFKTQGDDTAVLLFLKHDI